MDYVVVHMDENGKVARADHIRCDGDDAALERAAAIHTHHALEVWQGERLIWRFDARLRT